MPPKLYSAVVSVCFRLHADAAYGGYFGLADNLSEKTRRAYDLLGGCIDGINSVIFSDQTNRIHELTMTGPGWQGWALSSSAGETP